MQYGTKDGDCVHVRLVSYVRMRVYYRSTRQRVHAYHPFACDDHLHFSIPNRWHLIISPFSTSIIFSCMDYENYQEASQDYDSSKFGESCTSSAINP